MIIRWVGKFSNIGRYLSAGIRAVVAVIAPPSYSTVALTLQSRSFTLTLESRSATLTLATRTATLTLPARD